MVWVLTATSAPPMPGPTIFDWWTGVWIPVIVGFISIVLAGAALVIARAANKTAQAALDLSREIAEREREERTQERDQELRERRYRAAEEGRRAFSRAMFGGPEPTNRDEAWDRIKVVVDAFRAACVREGLFDEASRPIVKWLFRSTDEVAKSIYRESGSGDPTGLRPWKTRGWRVFQTEFVRQLARWEAIGEFDADRTIEQGMRFIRFLGEDPNVLSNVRLSMDETAAAGAQDSAHENLT